MKISLSNNILNLGFKQQFFHKSIPRITLFAEKTIISNAINKKDDDVSEEDLYSKFDKLLSTSTVCPEIGDKVVGTVVSMDKKSVYVDMGLKDYALLPREEVSISEESAENILSIGESREFLVISVSKETCDQLFL